MKTLLINKSEVNKLLSMELAISSVKEAYRMFYIKKIKQPPIMSIDIDEHSGELDVKSCYSKSNESISIKIASGYWNNPKNYSLSTMMAQITIYDAKNGYPLCIMDGEAITGYRTGAAGGLSASLLARKDSKSIGLIGSGMQARMQVLAVKSVLDIRDVYVYSNNKSHLALYKKDMEEVTDIKVHICDSYEDAIRNHDIIITTTPSSKAIIKKEWISKGMHIIAVGADMAGKEELDPYIFSDARVFVDSISQCLERGEVRNPIKKNIISESDINGELSELLMGDKLARISDDDITIFDTTGIGVQDNTLSFMIYAKAKELKLGTEFDFLK